MTACIIAAHRTAVMPRGGAFAALAPHEMAAPLVVACLASAGIAPDQVDEIILANAIGMGGNPARLVALAAGLPERVAGLSVDRQCAGGLDALLLAKAMVESGQAQVVLAGGVESYSRRPLRLETSPSGGTPRPYDQPPFTPWPERDPQMTAAAAELARYLGIDRAAQDAWAVASHAKALAARDMLRHEILPLPGLASQDDGFTRNLSSRLAARAPVLDGTVTTANTAVAADAAALCLVVSEKIASRAIKALPLTCGATLGDRPDMPGLAPIAAIRETLIRACLEPERLAAIEIMEAYAVQAIACVTGAGLDPARVNQKGGALARGHPIGASGAILATRLFHDLEPGQTGLAAIAAAGGIGSALIIGA